MQLSYQVDVNKPIQQVWDYTNDSDNLIHWLNDFVRYERVTGEPGSPAVGDVANVTYTQPGGEFTMIETVVASDAPHHVKLLMTSKHMDMEILNDFEEIDATTTRLTASADFIRLGLMMKAIFLVSSQKKMLADHKRQIDKLKELIEAA